MLLAAKGWAISDSRVKVLVKRAYLRSGFHGMLRGLPKLLKQDKIN